MSAKRTMPPHHQDRSPGLEWEMRPRPIEDNPAYRGSRKLDGKVALVTGGDSGIGRSVAIHFAKEGADIAILYLDEHTDAEEARGLVEREGRRALTIAGDVGDATFCRAAVERVVAELGRLDVLVNNAAEQHHRSHVDPLADVTPESLERVFRTNIFGYFYMAKAALAHLPEDEGAIVNTTSVTAYEGSPHLIDYAATKGAIVAFTRSLAKAVVKRGIRVNAVAPGPVWTPLIPSSFPAEEVETFGARYPMGRPAHPYEIAPAYVFLASADASYMTGQVLHPNGGEIVGS